MLYPISHESLALQNESVSSPFPIVIVDTVVVLCCYWGPGGEQVRPQNAFLASSWFFYFLFVFWFQGVHAWDVSASLSKIHYLNLIWI